MNLKTETETQRQRPRQTNRVRDRDKHRDRGRGKDKDRDRDRDTEIDAKTDTGNGFSMHHDGLELADVATPDEVVGGIKTWRQRQNQSQSQRQTLAQAQAQRQIVRQRQRERQNGTSIVATVSAHVQVHAVGFAGGCDCVCLVQRCGQGFLRVDCLDRGRGRVTGTVRETDTDRGSVRQSKSTLTPCSAA